MDTTLLFLCLGVVAGVWAKPADGSDLNLKSIFRTPRDFSKVNFDHFELLERNNFNDEDKECASASEKREISRAEDKLSKSMANAQVMLRIGGEDIHDCNRVILHHPPSAPSIKENNFYSEHHQPVYNDIRYPFYTHPYSAYPYVHQPVTFPGYYYNPNPLPNYLPSSYQTVNNHLVPTEFVTKPPETVTTLTYIEEGENGPTTEGQTVTCTETPNPQVILEKPSPCDTQIINTGIVHAPVQQTSCITNPEPVQTIVHTPCTTSHIEETPTLECSTASPICASTIHPEPTHNKVEYVDVHLGHEKKTCVEPLNTGTLVEHSEPVQTHETPVVVSHPVVEEKKTLYSTPQEEVVISQAPSENHDAPCSCDDSNIPFGHKLSKDVDSLHEITDNGLYNEENVVNVRSPLQSIVETTMPVHQEDNPICSIHNVVTHHYPQREVVQVVGPSHQTIEQNYVAQEVVQDGGSNTVTKIETPCESKTVQSSCDQVLPELTQIEWSTPKPPQQNEVTVVDNAPQTIESGTQEVVHIGNSLSPSSSGQAEWSIKKFLTSPSYRNELLSYSEPSYSPEVVRVSKNHNEVVELPWSTKEIRVQKPVVYCSGYHSRGGSQVSVDLTRYGNERPKVYLEGYESHTGSGYYSDPLRSVVYKHPVVFDSYKVPVIERVKYIEPHRTVVEALPHSTIPYREHVSIVNPWSSLLESYRYSPVRHHSKYSEPHIYKVVPKYDIIPRRDIRPLNIPDLVHTNQYLKLDAPRKYHGEHGRKSPHWKKREAPLETVCQPCSRYRAELDELC